MSYVRPLRFTRNSVAAALALAGGLLALSTAANAYGDNVRRACSGDYHRFCGQYSPNSSQMRACMQANGHSLSGQCVNALVDAGIIDRSRLRRR